MPAEGRGFRWKGWRKGVGSGSGRKAYHPDERAAMPDVITCISEGDDPSGRRRQGVIRSGDVPADQRKGASLVPRLARPARSSRPRTPCASRMIPPESPVPEIGTPGSESGGRNRAHGSRTAARCESAGSATEPYRLRASPRLYSRDAGNGRICGVHKWPDLTCPLRRSWATPCSGNASGGRRPCRAKKSVERAKRAGPDGGRRRRVARGGLVLAG